MTGIVAGRILDGKVEALLLKISEMPPHSFVLRSVEKRYDAWHVVSHSHVSVEGNFYRIAVLAPFEASVSGPLFSTRFLPVEGTVLEVLSMDQYLESRGK